jgi:hypothetical protein
MWVVHTWTRVLAALLFSMSHSRLLYGMTVTVGIAVCIALIAARALLLVNRIHTAKFMKLSDMCMLGIVYRKLTGAGGTDASVSGEDKGATLIARSDY